MDKGTGLWGVRGREGKRVKMLHYWVEEVMTPGDSRPDQLYVHLLYWHS